MRATFINQYRSVSGTPNKTEDRANTIDWLICLFNTPAWQDCYIDSDKKLQPRCRKYPRVTMRMTCRFIPERGVEKRYPRGASRLKTMAICDIRQTCRSRIHNVSSKRNRLESRRRYTPEIRDERMKIVHTPACILRAAFVRFNMFDIRSFIRIRDRRYLCKQTKAGYVGLRLPTTGAGLRTRSCSIALLSVVIAHFVFPATLDYGWIIDVSGNRVDVHNRRG